MGGPGINWCFKEVSVACALRKEGGGGIPFTRVLHLIALFLQMDCPEDVASYIHRVGRTARYHSGGRSVLFLMPSELKMLEKLQAAKVPIQFIKVEYLQFLCISIAQCPSVSSVCVSRLLFGIHGRLII